MAPLAIVSWWRLWITQNVKINGETTIQFHRCNCKYKTSSVILIDIRPQNGELKICVYIVIRGIQEVLWFVGKLLLVSHLLVILISVIPLSYLKFIWRFQHICHGYKNILETFIDFLIKVSLSYVNHLWVVISLSSPCRLQIRRPFLITFFRMVNSDWYFQQTSYFHHIDSGDSMVPANKT